MLTRPGAPEVDRGFLSIKLELEQPVATAGRTRPREAAPGSLLAVESCGGLGCGKQHLGAFARRRQALGKQQPTLKRNVVPPERRREGTDVRIERQRRLARRIPVIGDAHE